MKLRWSLLFSSMLGLVSPSAWSAGDFSVPPKYHCECFQNVPFEGYIIYVIEKYQGQESWLPLEAPPTNYDGLEECQAAIKVDAICEDLSKM